MKKQKLNEATLSEMLKGLREIKNSISGQGPEEVLTVGEMAEIMNGLLPRFENCQEQLELTMKELNTLIFWLEKIQDPESLPELL